MKTISKLLPLFLFVFLISSCQKESIESESQQVATFKNLEVLLPSGYDAKILGYGQDDYEKLFSTSLSNARISGEEAPLNLGQLTLLLRNVKGKYPDLSKMRG